MSLYKSHCMLIFICLNLSVFPQQNFELQNVKSTKIQFRLVNNLIVLPVTINGVPLSFLLDTGVSRPIIFNFFDLKNQLSIHQTELNQIQGLGTNATIEVLRSTNNTIIIGDAIHKSHDLFAITDTSINFAPSLGFEIHGIIGYDVFKDFVVEVNYNRKFIILHDPKFYSPKFSNKWRQLPLKFYNKKPIIEAAVSIEGLEIPVNLLIDTGGSDAIWLFEDSTQSISIPENSFDDFLGKGLSGTIFGKRAELESFRLSDFKLRNVNVAFPQSSSVHKERIYTLRNGSLMGEVLHHFNWVFNYKSQWVAFKKNSDFNDPFKYNKSGIVMQYSGVQLVKKTSWVPDNTSGNSSPQSSKTINYSPSYGFEVVPELVISEIRPSSPAAIAGLKIDDVVISINSQKLSSLTLQKAIEQFYGADGKRIKMIIERNGVLMKFQFRLQDLLHKKSTN